MRCEIFDLAKFKHACLEINGITVISGLNNTGKTLIAKILFASVKSVSNLDQDFRELRIGLVSKTLLDCLSNGRIFQKNSVMKISAGIVDDFDAGIDISEKRLKQIISKNKIEIFFPIDAFKVVADIIKIDLSSSEKQYLIEKVRGHFWEEFYAGIFSAYSSESRIELFDGVGRAIFMPSAFSVELKEKIGEFPGNVHFFDNPGILDDIRYVSSVESINLNWSIGVRMRLDF